jgi:hypothetical protein
MVVVIRVNIAACTWRRDIIHRMVGELPIYVGENDSDGEWGWDEFFFEYCFLDHGNIYVIVCIVVIVQGETVVAKGC